MMKIVPVSLVNLEYDAFCQYLYSMGQTTAECPGSSGVLEDHPDKDTTHSTDFDPT